MEGLGQLATLLGVEADAAEQVVALSVEAKKSFGTAEEYAGVAENNGSVLIRDEIEVLRGCLGIAADAKNSCDNAGSAGVKLYSRYVDHKATFANLQQTTGSTINATEVILAGMNSDEENSHLASADCVVGSGHRSVDAFNMAIERIAMRINQAGY